MGSMFDHWQFNCKIRTAYYWRKEGSGGVKLSKSVKQRNTPYISSASPPNKGQMMHSDITLIHSSRYGSRP